jgi:Rod binding domain-containing protein
MEITPLIGSVATGYGSQAPQAPEFTYGENEQGLKDASRDFVAILFSNMFTAMRGNPEDEDKDEEGNSNSLFGGENVSMFMGFLDQEIGKKFTEQGGQDLVNALYSQLKGDNVLPKNGAEKAAADNKLKQGTPVTEKVVEKVDNAAINLIEKNKVI